MVKFTKKQVLEKIEALEGDLYSEVLTLTREEKNANAQSAKKCSLLTKERKIVN